MVGPWQVPVSDVAVTRTGYGFNVVTGEAMAIGERTPLALIDTAASARIAIGESITNLCAAYISSSPSDSSNSLSRVKLSANWMCASSKAGEGAGLYEAVKAVGMELCPQLGVGIPVGKDSMSMGMKWTDDENGNPTVKEVTSPLSLIVTAFAPVTDVGKTWTPQLQKLQSAEPTVLIFFDLAAGKQRLGGSALAQVFNQLGGSAPDVESAEVLKAFWKGCMDIRSKNDEIVLAYHDRSDGGLFTTIAEMAFAGRVGLEISLDALPNNSDPLAALFNEELGAVVQIRERHLEQLMSVFLAAGLHSNCLRVIGRVLQAETSFTIIHHSEIIFNSTRQELQRMWSETSFQMQSIRDNPLTAKEEFDLIADEEYKGLFYAPTFTHSASPPVAKDSLQPKIAILREQGVNGHVELAWAFTAAGFAAVDVHMTDILSGRISLSTFRGLAAAGGFSYGDVLGAGRGWAHSVLLNPLARREFQQFFARKDTFAIGVCNGCQFFSHLKEIIPGADAWPDFKPNASGRFEARVCMVEVVDSETTRQSVFLSDMVGSKLPIAVAHGEGRVVLDSSVSASNTEMVALRYIDSDNNPTEKYPLNPNGSPSGITGVQTPDGRVLALMPHPERVVAIESNSWFPKSSFTEKEWSGTGPWFRLFQNARKWCN